MRVLIISHDIIGHRMAGPGIRSWELARALASQQQVTLIAPHPIDIHDPTLRCEQYTWGAPTTLAVWLHDADVVFANGFVLLGHPELAHIAQPLALDLYDPTLLENLELFRHQPLEQRQAQHRQDVNLLERQLASGDFLICATERQRDLYIGALMATGRLGPALIDASPDLRAFITVVPFGLSNQPPEKHYPVLRGIVSGIDTDALILLWTGGLWDWMDPLTLIEALPWVIQRHPNTRLVFLAGQHPNNAYAMKMPQIAEDCAATLGLLGSHVFFYPDWIPYLQRADFLFEADIAVSLHRNHLETTYAAVRSRFLDHLWAGLPSVVSAGDSAAHLVAEHDLGCVVAPGDVLSVASALNTLLSDVERRKQCATHACALAEQYTWERVVAPLRNFCHNPRRAPDRTITDNSVTQASAIRQPPDSTQSEHNLQAQAQDMARNAAIQSLTAAHRIVEPPLPGGWAAKIRQLVIQQIVRPFVAPLIEQQNAYNAAVAQALAALAENSDVRRSERYAHFDQLLGRVSALENRHQHVESRHQRIEHQLAEMEGRLADLDDADTLLAEHLVASAESAMETPQS